MSGNRSVSDKELIFAPGRNFFDGDASMPDTGESLQRGGAVVFRGDHRKA
jgi:hypothetical protein